MTARHPFALAESECQMQGGHLMSLLARTEMEFVYQLEELIDIASMVWMGQYRDKNNNFQVFETPYSKLNSKDQNGGRPEFQLSWPKRPESKINKSWAAS